MFAKTMLASAALILSALPAQAACMDDFDALQVRFNEMFSEPAKGAEAAPDAEPSSTDGTATTSDVDSAPAGGASLALTGDPLNPRPAEPSTAEVPTATPTSEEATSVMPGADASVELDVEQSTTAFNALREEAVTMNGAGNESGCMERLQEAQRMFPAQQ